MAEKRFDPSKAQVLFSEERRTLLPVEAVVQHLELVPEDVVADLGAGSGYFTIPMAKQVKGPVYAVDIEPKMLALLKERVRQGKKQEMWNTSKAIWKTLGWKTERWTK
jgi:ubiquinone/menaquinone biosynthesis C-methylase UbiE